METIVGSFKSLFGSLLGLGGRKGERGEGVGVREVHYCMEREEYPDWETPPMDIAAPVPR